jgi:hypothetical protein
VAVLSFFFLFRFIVWFILSEHMLQLRSPVFAAMVSSAPTADEPISLQESGPSLKTFFTCLYRNDPYPLLKGENVLAVAKLAFKYHTQELLTASFNTASRWAKKAKLSGGPSPTLPELLLLGQETKNTTILDAVLKKGIASFCTLPVAARCVAHPGQPLPCVYKTGACTKLVYVDDDAHDVLKKLNPATLVEIIESLVSSIPRARAY